MMGSLVGVESILDNLLLVMRASRASWATGSGRSGHGQSELESQACDSAQHGPGKPADSLGPAEPLLGTLALLLADRITRVARRASIDRRGPAGRVLRNVRRHVEPRPTNWKRA